jgi:hypothetical protein
MYTPLPSPIRATCPVHLILPDFITRTNTCYTYTHKYLYTLFILWVIENATGMSHLKIIVKWITQDKLADACWLVFGKFKFWPILYTIHTNWVPHVCDQSLEKNTRDVHSNAHKVIAGFFLSPDPEVT